MRAMQTARRKSEAQPGSPIASLGGPQEAASWSRPGPINGRAPSGRGRLKFVRDHFEEFVNRRNAAVIRKNMTPDFHDHDGPGGKPTGAEGDERMMNVMYQAMPDLRVTIEDMIAEGDKVMCRNIWRWTDATSGKKMQVHGFVLWRFEGTKIAERWATVTAPSEGTSWNSGEGPQSAHLPQMPR